MIYLKKQGISKFLLVAWKRFLTTHQPKFLVLHDESSSIKYKPQVYGLKKILRVYMKLKEWKFSSINRNRVLWLVFKKFVKNAYYEKK